MQGKSTETSVVRALQTLNGMKSLDAIIITRGGGSIAELSSFDSQSIAEAVASCSIPVLSGIGHEINTTITDLTAHTYAKTPTAIAQFLISRVQEFLNDLDQKRECIFDYARQKLDSEKSRLRQWAMSVHANTSALFKSHHQLMATLSEQLKARPREFTREEMKDLLTRKDTLTKTIHLQIEKLKNRINNYQKLAQMASPANTLKRGFSITRTKDGHILRKSSDANSGQEISTELFDGKIISKVVNVS